MRILTEETIVELVKLVAEEMRPLWPGSWPAGWRS